jgi:hypothetical protein
MKMAWMVAHMVVALRLCSLADLSDMTLETVVLHFLGTRSYHWNTHSPPLTPSLQLYIQLIVEALTFNPLR